MKLARIILNLGIAVSVLVVGSEILCGQDQAEELIKEIIKGARSDAERSAKLLEAVAVADDNQKLKIVLLTKAVEYGTRGLRTPDDCERLQSALAMLVKAAPERESQWFSQQAKVYRRWYGMVKDPDEKQKLGDKVVDSYTKAGHAAAVRRQWKDSLAAYNNAKSAARSFKLPVYDKLIARTKVITSIYRARDRASKYAETLKDSPDKIEARTSLVELLLTVLDNPAAAGKHVNADLDQKLQSYVPLAAKDISEVPAQGCKSLAQWYDSELSKSASPLVKYRMLKRAKAYYEQALELHGKSDVTAASLKLAVSGIDSKLSKLTSADPFSCIYCLAGEQMSCLGCVVKGKSTGTIVCPPCKGLGRVKCASCGGYWGVKCTYCSGKGGTYVRRYSYISGGYRKVYSKCSSCKGSGIRHKVVSSSSSSSSSSSRRSSSSSSDSSYGYYRAGACPKCGRLPRKIRGSAMCKTCKGKGRSGQCETCSGSKTVPCTHCH